MENRGKHLTCMGFHSTIFCIKEKSVEAGQHMLQQLLNSSYKNIPLRKSLLFIYHIPAASIKDSTLTNGLM